MDAKSREIVCTACGTDALLRIEPIFEGFRKTGERSFCASCGFEFPAGQVPFKEKKTISVFSEADREKKVDVFSRDDRGRNCRYCEHYTVNPFTQRCGLTNRIVQAMDCCEKFQPREAEEKQEKILPAGGPLADRLEQ
jgi:hypothetical protein